MDSNQHTPIPQNEQNETSIPPQNPSQENPLPDSTPSGSPQKTALPVKMVLLSYGVVLAVALIWGWLRGHPNIFFLEPDSQLSLFHPLPLSGAALILFRYGGALACGLAFGFLVVWGSRLGVKYSTSMREMQEGFASMLGEMSSLQILVATVSSAVAEEALFRGAMLPTLGLWISSAIFGILHTPMDRRIKFWPLLAFVMGLGFGLSAMAFGHLLAPMVAHFVINFFNLYEISREARKLDHPI